MVFTSSLVSPEQWSHFLTNMKASSETSEIEEGVQNMKVSGMLEDYMFEVPRGQSGWDMSEVVYQVRSPNYLKSKKKAPSLAPLFNFVGMQMVEIEGKPKSPSKRSRKKSITSFSEDGSSNQIHMAMQNWSALPKEDIENEYLIVNYIVPGSPGVQVVMYFRASDEARDAIRYGQDMNGINDSETDTKEDPNEKVAEKSLPPLEGWQKIINTFWKADKDYCDARFKVIPCMDKKAPWAVKMAVGEKPALVGKKLEQYYFRGANYFEVDMDISSSSTASRILTLVRSLSTSLIVDVGLTIEATAVDELPERILCQCRLWGLDFNRAVPHMPLREKGKTV